MSALPGALQGRRITGLIALGPRAFALALGPSPRAYLWVLIDRKEARLAFAPDLPIAPDPRGSPFGALETAIAGLIVREAAEGARGALALALAPSRSKDDSMSLLLDTDGPRVNVIARSRPEGAVLWALHRDEVDRPGTPPSGFQAPRVVVCEESEDRARLHDSIAAAFQEDFGRELIRGLDAAERALARRIEALEGDRARASERLLDRRRAEILLAHYAEIPRGASRVGLPDPYADSPGATIDVELDPSLSPHENAARLFRGAKRGERGEKLVLVRLAAARRSLAKLEELRRVLPTRPPKEALLTLDQYLQEAKVSHVKARGNRPEIHLGRRTAAAPRAGRPGRQPSGARHSAGPRTYVTTDGWEVWVGRNDAQNDQITHRLSNPHDYWFHAVGVPGSHVILRRPSRNATLKHRTLEEAASIAAYFSKARKLTRVPVIYTERKFVSRPRRGKPGQALCSREREILVRPRLPEGGSGTDTKGRREVSSD